MRRRRRARDLFIRAAREMSSRHTFRPLAHPRPLSEPSFLNAFYLVIPERDGELPRATPERTPVLVRLGENRRLNIYGELTLRSLLVCERDFKVVQRTGRCGLRYH